MLSYSMIKLIRCHKLSVGDIFTDKPQNREKLLMKPKIHWQDNRYRFFDWKHNFWKISVGDILTVKP